MQHLKKYLLLYTLLPLIALMVVSSYYRFLIVQDYTVGYEGYCEPTESSCFVYCEDETCEEPFYYSWIERHAGTLYEMCGPLVTECEAAYECSADSSCSITYCEEGVEANNSWLAKVLGQLSQSETICDTLSDSNQPITESDV